MTHQPARYSNTLIFPASLDPDAVTVVNRLNEAGLESYFVGGCVRDLLLGLIPKDFDISTAARPRQIRRLFRNSRIIGRRFKLAHVHFGQNIIEVATFRRTPEGSGEPGVTPGRDGDGSGADGGGGDGDNEGAGDSAGEGPGELPDLLITRDNEFGTAEQDAVRRDFTINALLYDVRTGEVIDYVGGVQDLNDRVLRTIGDPMVRFAEDPVRMLRAVKFMSRLGLHAAPDVEAALHASAESIELSAPPRVLEEIYKLMGCGHSGPGLTRLLDYGLLQRLLPEVAGYWSGHRDELIATGEALDRLDRGQRAVSNAFLLAALCLQPWRAALAEQPEADPLLRAHELFDDAALRMSIPRRDITGMRQLLLTQLRLDGRRRGRRFRMRDFLSRPSTEEGLQLLHLAARAGYADPEVHAEWMQRIAEAAPEDRPLASGRGAGAEAGDDSPGDEQGEGGVLGAGPHGADEREPGRRRRRRRGGRRHRARQGEGRGPSAGGASVARAGEFDDAARRPADGSSPSDSEGGDLGDSSGEQTGAGDGSGDAGEAREDAAQGAGAGGSGPGGRRRRRRGGRGRRGRHRREPGADSATQPGDPSAGPDSMPRETGGHEEGRRTDADDASSGGSAEQAEGASPNGGDTAGGNGARRRRGRGGRRHRGRNRDRDRQPNGEPHVAESAAEPSAEARDAAAPAPAAAPNERSSERSGERRDRGEREQGRGRRSRRGGRNSGGGSGSGGGGGQRRDARPPREAREPRESNASGADESLSPARPSKAKEPEPGSRLRDNPESVEDLFDW